MQLNVQSMRSQPASSKPVHFSRSVWDAKVYVEQTRAAKEAALFHAEARRVQAYRAQRWDLYQRAYADVQLLNAEIMKLQNASRCL